MRESKVSKRYAKALMGLGRELETAVQAVVGVEVVGNFGSKGCCVT